MGRHTDSKDETPIRFRVQADRRQVDALPTGATDRRAKRMAALSAKKSADIDDTRSFPSSDITGNE